MSAISPPYLCPECLQPLNEDWCCLGGHAFGETSGVRRLVTDSMADRLAAFLPIVRDRREREGKRIVDEAVYEQLPEARKDHPEWKLRVEDLDLIRLSLAVRATGVLELGAYNGWLTHHLAEMGHEVTAVDYFDDPYDGLGARRFYRNPRWLSLQMDLCDLRPLNRTYGAVIVNRCLQFFPDPLAAFAAAQQRVCAGGVLIATGLDFYRDPRRREARVARWKDDHQKRYGCDFFLHQTRGLLDSRDREGLESMGLTLGRYRSAWRSDLRSRLDPKHPRLRWGFWLNDEE